MKRTVMFLACLALGACSAEDLADQVPDAGVPDARLLPPASIVFVNTSPTQFIPGDPADSVTNTSGIVTETLTTTGVVGKTLGVWPEAVTCLREMLTPYNVVVVEEDPGNVDHIEIAVSNDPSDLGLSGTTGIAPATPDCAGLQRGVAFAFDLYGGDMKATCNNLGWLLGHTVGIDTLYHCPDVTTFLGGCGTDKSFTDNESECGEFEARECQCGGTTQNSHQKMLDFYGPRE